MNLTIQLVLALIILILLYQILNLFYPLYGISVPYFQFIGLQIKSMGLRFYYTLLIKLPLSDPRIYFLEQKRRQADDKIQNTIRLNKQEKGNRTDSRLSYKWVRVGLLAALAAFIYLAPAENPYSYANMSNLVDSKVNQTLASMTVWFETETDSEEVEASFTGASDSTRDRSKATAYTLVPVFNGAPLNGGSLRSEPVDDLSIQNMIKSIEPGEVMYFYGESEVLGDITWFQVETENGDVGWISKILLREE